MPTFVKALFFIIVGAIAGLVVGWTYDLENGILRRAGTGLLLGGYVIPDGFEVLGVEEIRPGIDSTTYIISIPACSALTRWDVSLSGSWSDVEEIRSGDGEDFLVRYEASRDYPFLRAESARFITTVHLVGAADSECASQTLMRLFETAYPAYARAIVD